MNIPQAKALIARLEEETWRSARRDAFIADVQAGVYAPGKLQQPRVSLLIALHELRAPESLMEWVRTMPLSGDEPPLVRPAPSATDAAVLAALAAMPPPVDLARIAGDDDALERVEERMNESLVPAGKFLEAVATESLEQALRLAKYNDEGGK